ncbi:hypothetical protein SAMN02745671_02193 [Anaerovibrio lipolyticus DSM 3074]|uniref:Transposase (putative) YhgA-like domain-containing protein n=1 Tax=Anaerovibrio lipolyticus DSM 3074 TaxID=1120997 RepID=A0A1M6FAB5_9FIRM|nr:hypothetical protein [Anaerovibrio lipolyticus]SHI94607.1 hypothetical protein SAMN02745671_02193 [Anaerovibrio lipolyticus DSM 3074]
MGAVDERRKRLYDKACKEVLSEKGIIGHILKTCVKEYQNVSVEDIVNKYIQGNPEVEKTTVFTKSHYEKIKKVYSIWVCTNSSKEWEYNIARYGIMEENIIGNAKAKLAHYDLLSVVMICLGKRQYTELEGLLRLLSLVLVDNNLSQQEKKNRLINEFAIKMTPSLERGVKEMCNLSEGVEQRGIEKGIELEKSETVIGMFKENLSVEMIARVTKLTVEQVIEIGKKNALI